MNSPMPPALAAIFGGPSSGPAVDKRGLPEAQAMRLQEAFVRRLAGNPFKPGDLVTPRLDASAQGAGNPHLVMDVIDPIMPSFQTNACCAEKRFDMRVSYVDGRGDIHTHWGESWEWEAWPVKAAPASAAEPTPVEPAAA